MENGLLNRISLLLVPAFYSLLARLLFASCRVEYAGIKKWKELGAAGPVIAAFWHYSIYYIIYFGRRQPLVAMVSASSDGEYVSRLLNHLGIKAVRGSRGARKRGFEALHEMVEWMAKGKNAAMVADGSQGPARVAQPGTIILASRTGAPILPMAWAADRYYALRSWDRSVLPRPFARIVFYCGEPLAVPARVRGNELERYRLELEKRLNELYERAWGRFGRREH